jgi:hypothetical protein
MLHLRVDVDVFLAMFRFYLGVLSCSQGLGDEDAARGRLQRVLEVEPRNREAQRSLEALDAQQG